MWIKDGLMLIDRNDFKINVRPSYLNYTSLIIKFQA